MHKTMLVNIIQKVNASEIRSETIDGHEYIVLPSKTQPPGVVMNGLMYPGEQTDAKIETLNGKAAPIDHPIINGKYIDAQDAVAALNFGAGVNRVTEKDESGAWNVEKWVNKEILENTTRGKRLQAAINEKRPIHTSTGVYLREVPNSSGENEYGEYKAEVEIIEFNHDAILPDSIGANTPEKGTGIFLNSQGDEVEVVTVNLSTDLDFSQSSNSVRNLLSEAVRESFPTQSGDNWIYVEDFNDSNVIYESNGKLFTVGYSIIDGEVTFINEPRPTDRKSSYEFNGGLIHKIVTSVTNMLKSNQHNTTPTGETLMSILKDNLTKLGVNFAEDATEADLLALHTETVITNSKTESITAEQIESIIDRKLKANKDELEAGEKSKVIAEILEIKTNSLTEEDLKALPLKALNALNVKQSKHSTPIGYPHNNSQNQDSDHSLDLNELLAGNK